MKKIFLLLLLLNKVAFAQIGFEKTYQFLTNEEAAKSCIQDSDGGYVFTVGPRSSTPLFLRDYGLIKLNINGDTVWHTTFFMNYNATIHLVKKAPDQGYVTIGLADDSVSGFQQRMLWLAKYDSLGYLSWSRFYSNPQFSQGSDCISASFVNNNKLLICNGSSSNFILLDSAYNFIVLKKYVSFGHTSNIKEPTLKFNSNFWYLTSYKPTITWPISLKILIVNSVGDSVKTIHIPNDSSDMRLVKVTNSYFISIGYKLTGSAQNTFIVSKIDSSGTRLWSKTLAWPYGNGNSYFSTSYATLLNGNIVVNFIPTNSAPDSRSFIYCFNDNGDSLWTQYFKNDISCYTQLIDIVATADSGLLACGKITEPGGIQKDYIVKTNSKGIILNATEQGLKQNQNYLHLYPNPASTYTNLHYVGSSKNACLSICNLQGQIIYREQLRSSDQRLTLNTTNFPPGLYFCNISAEGKNLLSKKLVVLK